ncbi:hypothetical protein JCM8547_009081 [Rhodosporidiobolus lusitaniae]
MPSLNGVKRTRADHADSLQPSKRLKPNSPSAQPLTASTFTASSSGWNLLEWGRDLLGKVLSSTAPVASVPAPTPSQARVIAPLPSSPFSSKPASRFAHLSTRDLERQLKTERGDWLWKSLRSGPTGEPQPAKPEKLLMLEKEALARESKASASKRANGLKNGASGAPRRANGVGEAAGGFRRKKPMGSEKSNSLSQLTVPKNSTASKKPSRPQPTSPDALPSIADVSLFNPKHVSPSPTLSSPPTPTDVLPPWAPPWDPATFFPDNLRPSLPATPLASTSAFTLDHLTPASTRPLTISKHTHPALFRDLSEPALNSPSASSPSRSPRERNARKQHKHFVEQRDSATIYELQNGARVSGLGLGIPNGRSRSGSGASMLAAEADEDESYRLRSLTSDRPENEEMIEVYLSRVNEGAEKGEQDQDTSDIKIKHGHSSRRSRQQKPITPSSLIDHPSYFPAPSPYAVQARPPPAKLTFVGVSKYSDRHALAREKAKETDRIFRTAKKTMADPMPEREPLEKYDELEASLKGVLPVEEEEAPRQKRRVFPDILPPEYQSLVDSAFRNRHYQSTMKGAEVIAHDLRKLRPGDWLNDEVINFVGVLINMRSDKADKEEKEGKEGARGEGERRVLKAFCFNTNFYRMLTETPGGIEKGFDKVKRWTKKFDTFEKDIIIIPINLGNNHWVCAAVNIALKRIEYYDSLGQARPGVYKNLRKWVEKEHMNRKKAQIDVSGWENYWDPNRPKQKNTWDCGVFTCMFMESLSRDTGDDNWDFGQDNMDYLRNKLALIVGKQDLMMDVEEWE